jgi:hypothetical protein
MLTNKDIRVENGNLVINGDKYPLDGQSPEAIMQIVEDNSDSTPTAESTAPVTSAGIKTYVDTAIGDLTQTGLTGVSVADQLEDAKGQIANVASGISAIAKKVITANDENDFLAQVFADLKADTQQYILADKYASIHRIYGWLGTNTYIVDAVRATGKWIESIVYAYDRLYIIEYNCDDNVIGTKKTATLT